MASSWSSPAGPGLWRRTTSGIRRARDAQADILKLGGIGRSFDIIESNGVLHHLADPFAGWRVLVALLRPRGLMNIGLYSKAARRDCSMGNRSSYGCTSPIFCASASSIGTARPFRIAPARML